MTENNAGIGDGGIFAAEIIAGRTGICSGALPMFDPTESGGTRKSAAVTTAEGLRRDILAYLKELGLTTMAVKRLDAQENLPESNVLADALRRLGDGE